MDYFTIGQRIRALRKEKKLSQEQLAEKVWISTTHMSHIENGRTKVSLPTLILIANALKTSVDSLLYDNIEIMYSVYDKEFRDLTADCTPEEREVILQAAIQVKAALKRK